MNLSYASSFSYLFVCVLLLCCVAVKMQILRKEFLLRERKQKRKSAMYAFSALKAYRQIFHATATQRAMRLPWIVSYSLYTHN